MSEAANPGPVGQPAGESKLSDSNRDPVAAPQPAHPPEGAERRRHTRQDILNQQLVPINLGDDNGGLLLDLSSGGAAVQSVAPLQSRASSPFAFRLPELNSPIEGTGVFVWVDDSGLAGGLRFDALSPQAQQLMEQWLKSNPTELAGLSMEAEPEPVASAPSAVEAPEDDAPHPAAPVVTALGTRAPELAAKLQRVAGRAQILSRAQGVCIALRDEHGAFICEASSGTAPDVGIPVNLERGLAAECIVTRGLVLCNDAQNDPRVDDATRRQLGLGSAALLPLLGGDILLGVLGVFSQEPHAFGEQGIARLRNCVRMLENDALREVGRALKAVGPGVAPGPSQASSPKGAQGGANLVTSILQIFTTVLLAFGVIFTCFMLYQQYRETPVSPSPRPASAPVRPVALAENPAPPAQSPVETALAHPLQLQSPSGAGDSLSRPVPVDGRTPPVASRTVQTTQAPEERSPSPPPATQAPAVSGPTPAPAQPDATQVENAVLPVASAQAAQPQVPMPTPQVEVLTEVLGTSPKSSRASFRLPARELSSGAEIAYPPAAVARHLQGSVILRVTVSSAGTVDNMQVLDGDETLAAQAVAAVRQWRYKPYLLDGREVGTDLLVTVNFVLTR